jgi:hypothetical protein
VAEMAFQRQRQAEQTEGISQRKMALQDNRGYGQTGKLAERPTVQRLEKPIYPMPTGVIQRQLLPVARHREVVVDAAKLLGDPVKATDAQWIQAIYQELQGVGHPAVDKCVAKLVEQHIIDQADWVLIERDFKLYRETKGHGLDVYERHNIPRVHGEAEANKWVASLIVNRIHDLYTTLPGFPGHAQQVQLAITQLVGWYQDGVFGKDAFERYKARIIHELTVGKGKSLLAIPDHAYTFEGGSTKKI